jgi:hypothetical protein
VEASQSLAGWIHNVICQNTRERLFDITHADNGIWSLCVIMRSSKSAKIRLWINNREHISYLRLTYQNNEIIEYDVFEMCGQSDDLLRFVRRNVPGVRSGIGLRSSLRLRLELRLRRRIRRGGCRTLI